MNRTKKKRASFSCALAFVLLAAPLFFAARARAGGEPRAAPPASSATDAVSVISVPPPSAPPPATPKLEPQVDLSALVGKPITHIEVSLDDDTWTLPDLPKVTSVRPGQTMSGGAARRAMDDVLESGRFARARVSASLDGTGVRLVVHVAQRRLIETLRMNLHGAPVDRDELLREADLSEGGEVLGVDVPLYKERAERYLARAGFPTATVKIETRETDDPERVLVLIDVFPGGARVLQRRVFYVIDENGTPAPSPRTLNPILEGYRVGVGDRADESALDAADVALTARLRAVGYQRVEITHDLVWTDALVTLRVRVTPGPHFEPRFVGNVHYDATALTGALGLDEETDLAPGHLTQKLKDFYMKRGFLDAEVSLEVRGGEHDRVHLLVFHIDENPRVAVAARTYPCLKLSEIRKLSSGGPRSPAQIGDEIDSYLDEDLPGSDLFRDPDPKGLDATITDPTKVRAGTRVRPLDLTPDSTFVPDTYDRAALHVQELYRNEGYLHAQVGPVLVIRRACDRRSPPGGCIPVPAPGAPPDECTYDSTNLPLPVAPLDPSFTCRPDPAHGVECEPEVTLRIPVKLGPRTILYDMQFTGAHALTEARLARASELVMGDPASALKMEDARRKLVDLYKEEGFAYADVKYTIDSSADHTRARVRFDVVEGDRVVVQRIVIRGNVRTNDATIRRRIALEVGKPYRTSDVRKTQERIATLNVFSNVNVGLDEPYVPQKSKTVIVTLTERSPQAIEDGLGVSTGEGIRGELDYTAANLGGEAIGFSLRTRLSYLPDVLIFDPVVKSNFDSLCYKGTSCFNLERLAARITGTVTLPEIGFGPLVRATFDAVAVHDLEHDFYLDKLAAIPTVYYRPIRELQFALSQSVEDNSAHIFAFNTIQDYLASVAAGQSGGGDITDLSALLRFPDVPSVAFSQKLVVTWDRRDNAFNPHKGTYIVSGFEHTDWNGLCPEGSAGGCYNGTGTNLSTPYGHTVKFTETIAAYFPVNTKITLAAEVRAGVNLQLNPSDINSTTYPDRLFFLGGVQSVRGYLQDSMVAQEDADKIAADYNKPANDPQKFTINDVGIRGGNLMLNPKLELRIPVVSPFETVVFVDAGNIWQSPDYLLHHPISLRYTAGTGIRVDTPIGPLAFDYGINMSLLFSSQNNARRSYEDFGAFHFAIGLF